jgi:hypothetical protein
MVVEVDIKVADSIIEEAEVVAKEEAGAGICIWGAIHPNNGANSPRKISRKYMKAEPNLPSNALSKEIMLKEEEQQIQDEEFCL